MAPRIPEVLYAFRVDQSVAVCPPQGMQVLSTSSPCRRHSDRSPRHSGREAEGDAEWSPSAALQADRLDAGRPQWGPAITTLAMFINHPITGIHPEVDLAGSMLDLGLAGFWILHVLCINYQPVLRSADGLMSEAVSCLAGMDLHRLKQQL